MKKFLFLVIAVINIAGCSNQKVKPTQVSIENSPNTNVTTSDSLATNNILNATLLDHEPSDLTLRDAVELTLNHSSELKTFAYELKSAEGKITQAKLLPNPEISLQVEDVYGTGDYRRGDEAQSTLQLSQLIELGGKRSARTDVAEAIRDQTENSLEIKKIEVLTNLTEQFIKVAVDQEIYELSQKAEFLAKEALQNIQKRTKAGSASELEETKAKIQLARAKIETEHAEHNFQTSKVNLASFWGVTEPKFKKIRADLYTNINLLPYPDLEALITRSLEKKRWLTERRLREAENRLAIAKSYPNFTLSGGPRRIESSNNDTWVFQVSMPLSIFDRNQGGRMESQAMLDQTPLTEKSSETRLKASLFGLYQEMKHSVTELEAMKREIIPNAEKSLKLAQIGYDRGSFTFLDLSDAQKTLVEEHRKNIEAAYAYHSHKNAIERLLGLPITDQ
jgi:cobalt-zinc-cadmium efflux system outer membrane protein